MDGLYTNEDPLPIIFVTVCLGGGAAWMAGRAIAQTWRPMWHVVAYMVLLGAAVRFIHFALFGADLIAPLSYAVDTLFLILVGCLGWRVMRTTQMVTRLRSVPSLRSVAMSSSSADPILSSSALVHAVMKRLLGSIRPVCRPGIVRR